MPSRWKNDRSLSRAEFEARFPDDAACARYLAAKRWPDAVLLRLIVAAPGLRYRRGMNRQTMQIWAESGGR